MLFLLFRLGTDRCALDAAQVAAVLPLVNLQTLPHTHPAVAGIFNFRGRPVPVIDLRLLALGQQSPQHGSTRIVLVHYPDAEGTMHLLGLIAEAATATMRRDRQDFVDPGVASEDAPYLGPVATDADGLVRWIDVHRLLPAPLRDVLFREPADR